MRYRLVCHSRLKLNTPSAGSNSQILYKIRKTSSETRGRSENKKCHEKIYQGMGVAKYFVLIQLKILNRI